MKENFNGKIIFPNNKDDINNALVFLHGYGANAEDLINIGLNWKNTVQKTVFVSPNAPFECEWSSSAFQWFDLTSIEPEKIGEGLEKAGPYLNKIIENIKLEFSLSDSQIIFFGFSQGAMMGLYHLCKRKESCAGLLAYSGLLFEDENFRSEISSKFPIRLFHGKNDEVIDFKNSVKSFESLKSFGFDVDYHIQEGLGHGIDNYGLEFGHSFIQKILNI
jgi:phospholipase/carboxylesterase